MYLFRFPKNMIMEGILYIVGYLRNSIGLRSAFHIYQTEGYCFRPQWPHWNWLGVFSFLGLRFGSVYLFLYISNILLGRFEFVDSVLYMNQ